MATVEVFTSLLSQGVAVVCLAWFMLRLESLVKENTKQISLNTRATMLTCLHDPQRPEGEQREARIILREAGGGSDAAS